MSVPPTASAGPQMWVRGPTAAQPDAEPTAPAPPARQPASPAQRPAAPAQQSAPAGVAAPTAPPAPTDPGVPTEPSAPMGRTAPPVGRTAPTTFSAPPPPAAAAVPSQQYPELGEPPRGGGGPVSWVGAHGGAGTSTLAELVGGCDMGRRWPDPAKGDPGEVLLVARTHGAGLRAAGRALEALQRGQHPAGVELLAVVLVADAPGRLPLQLGRRVRVLRSAADVHRVPWIPSWRGEERTGPVPKVLRELAALAGTGLDRPGKQKKAR
ncbi:DUF6668 family protein [Streptomyces sp. 8N114]|uniref:DUF6668 family protein n=1 Tax=Streptomyces sp. 8N114 TaxID=3457419 RepID=UPI003FD1170D